MSGGKVLGALAVGIVVGLTAHHAPEPEVHVKREVKVVKVPHYIIRKEVKVKTINNPIVLPESCETALDYAGESVNKNNDLTTLARSFYNYVDRLDVRLLSDPDAAHHSEVWLKNRLDRMDLHNYQNLQLGDEMKSTWELCKADVQRSLNGDDVTPADGRRAVSP